MPHPELLLNHKIGWGVVINREDLELDLLIEAIYRYYGYDFRNYSKASIKRRVLHHLSKSQEKEIGDLIPAVLRNRERFQQLFFDISITVTEMFRDPWFYRALREQVFPFLRTYPFINIWHAGCATGEEVYSLAIVLKEENLYNRARIYATDFNDMALEKAKTRIYPLERIKEYSQQYIQAGGKSSLADYYHSQYDSIILTPELQQNITFANHNLATDGPFAEMHLILCRNVLIYFERDLQNKVLKTFQESLCYNGFLCLGSKESLQFSTVAPTFSELNIQAKIYQNKRR